MNYWQSIGKSWPPKDSIFLLSWDGYWIRAKRGNKEFIIAEWLHEDFIWDLNDLNDNYWFEVPFLPDVTTN